MKLTIYTVVFGVLKFAAVSGERISFGEERRRETETENEHSFWSSFVIQDLNSMTTPTPNPTPAPSKTSSNAPTISGTTSGTFSGTTSGTFSGTTSGSSRETTSGTTSVTKSDPACESIEGIFCSVPEFSTLCNLVGTAGLKDTLSKDKFTIFAPVDTAFGAISAEVSDALNDVSILKDTLLYHTVPEVEILAENLVCEDNLVLANFKETTTMCIGDEIFQVGNGNSPNALPKIIGRDGTACNGIIHAVDQVLLQSMTLAPTVAPTYSTISPTPPLSSSTSNSCQTIGEVICSLPEFELLCALAGDANLISSFEDIEEKYTLFAPTNTAFESLPEELASAVVSDTEFKRKILLSHVIGSEILSNQLECGGEYSMLSGQETTTVCADNRIFQRGAENELPALPEIIAPDGITCNGVIHAVDQVIVPSTAR